MHPYKSIYLYCLIQITKFSLKLILKMKAHESYHFTYF